MTKGDLAQIKKIVETVVTPRFDKIDLKLEEHDVMLEAIIFVSDKHTKQIETLQKDMTIVKKDVNILKEDVSILKKDVAVLKEDVDELKTDIKIIKTDVQALKFGQQSGELRFIKLEKKVFAV